MASHLVGVSVVDDFVSMVKSFEALDIQGGDFEPKCLECPSSTRLT